MFGGLGEGMLVRTNPHLRSDCFSYKWIKIPREPKFEIFEN